MIAVDLCVCGTCKAHQCPMHQSRQEHHQRLGTPVLQEPALDNLQSQPIGHSATPMKGFGPAPPRSPGRGRFLKTRRLLTTSRRCPWLQLWITETSNSDPYWRGSAALVHHGRPSDHRLLDTRSCNHQGLTVPLLPQSLLLSS